MHSDARVVSLTPSFNRCYGPSSGTGHRMTWKAPTLRTSSDRGTCVVMSFTTLDDFCEEVALKGQFSPPRLPKEIGSLMCTLRCLFLSFRMCNRLLILLLNRLANTSGSLVFIVVIVVIEKVSFGLLWFVASCRARGVVFLIS